MNVEILRIGMFLASLFFGYQWVKAIIQNRGKISFSQLYFVVMITTGLLSIFLQDSNDLFKDALSIIAIVFVTNWFIRFANSQDGLVDIIVLLVAMVILQWISGQTFYLFLVGGFIFILLGFKAIVFWYFNSQDIIEYQKMAYLIQKYKITKTMDKLTKFQREVQGSVTSKIIIFLWKQQK